jgi:hypothetical protein
MTDPTQNDSGLSQGLAGRPAAGWTCGKPTARPERVAHMAPKPEAIRLTRLTFIFGMVVAATLTILAITTWAQVNSTPIYRPQYLLVY